MTPEQLQLDETEHPKAIECDGPHLEAKLAQLRSQGAKVQSMDRVENALWRLNIYWPIPE